MHQENLLRGSLIIVSIAAIVAGGVALYAQLDNTPECFVPKSFDFGRINVVASGGAVAIIRDELTQREFLAVEGAGLVELPPTAISPKGTSSAGPCERATLNLLKEMDAVLGPRPVAPYLPHDFVEPRPWTDPPSTFLPVVPKSNDRTQ